MQSDHVKWEASLDAQITDLTSQLAALQDLRLQAKESLDVALAKNQSMIDAL